MRNLLNEYGYTDKAVSTKISDTWLHIFEDEATKFYHEDGDTGFIMDTGNTDARTEGMSYGMMMAVQMNRQDIFDKIWLWSKIHMYHETGPLAGYFAWSCAPDGTRNYDGPAPDGEEYYALALHFASNLWSDREPPFDYSKQAKDIIHAMIHKGEEPGTGEPMFHPDNKLILFVPGSPFSDPSYHLPHFYELIAKWCYPEDREFMLLAAKASREYIPLSCHPVTGLAPNYAEFDGTPFGHDRYPISRTHYSDSYRVALNIGLDVQWSGRAREWQIEVAEKLQRFYLSRPDSMTDTVVNIDGTPYPEEIMHPLGLLSTAAAISIARPVNSDSKELIKRFMEAEMRTDKRRYYDNCLYFFSLLALSGRYRVIWPRV
jgi:oligosaccharide reducing-end xylanase